LFQRYFIEPFLSFIVLKGFPSESPPSLQLQLLQIHRFQCEHDFALFPFQFSHEVMEMSVGAY